MKKVILIVLPVLLLGGAGGAYFAAQKGIIKIPGLTPASKLKGAQAQYGEKKDPTKTGKDKSATAKKEPTKPKSEPRKTPDPVVAKEPETVTDPKSGRAKLASIWNKMEVEALVSLTADWTEDELAPQIAALEQKQATKLIEAIATKDAKRASSLSKKIQKFASILEPEEEEG